MQVTYIILAIGMSIGDQSTEKLLVFGCVMKVPIANSLVLPKIPCEEAVSNNIRGEATENAMV